MSDAAFREKLADWYVQSEGLKYTRFRTMTALSRGQTPGPESSIGKIIAANQLQDLTNSAMELEDQFGIIDDGALAPAVGGVPERAAVLAGPAHRRRHGRDPEEHHRRARARPARRHPGRQGRGVQGHADRPLSAASARYKEGAGASLLPRLYLAPWRARPEP